MAGAQVIRRFESAAELEHELEENFLNGGCFVEGRFELEQGDVCELLLVAPGGAEMELAVTVVWVAAGDAPGVGVEFTRFDRALLDALAEFVRAAERLSDPARAVPEDETPADDQTDDDASPEGDRKRRAVSPHERLRGLTGAQQLKVAREGDINERVVLERIYGKAVWDALLSNPRLTHPEVARIARMGTLPRPQLEQIVGNPQWLTSGQVRRALLANRRLSLALIDKVLRATPKHELKLAPRQTAYPQQVRDAAKRLLGG